MLVSVRGEPLDVVLDDESPDERNAICVVTKPISREADCQKNKNSLNGNELTPLAKLPGKQKKGQETSPDQHDSNWALSENRKAEGSIKYIEPSLGTVPLLRIPKLPVFMGGE